MRFAILGPLAVFSPRGPVHIEGAKRRTLLIALLAGANRLVSFDELTEWLWPEGPPRSAMLVMQAHVSVLRRQLEPERAPRSQPQLLLTVLPGYMMRLEKDQLDILEFEALVQAGTQSLQRGHTEVAARQLAAALDLWTGEALCGARHLPAAQHEIARLDELRLTATGLRIEACLQIGLYDDVIPQLTRLIVDHPFHERFYAQLMIALARSGRRAEALAVYRRAQEILAAELDVEPGDDLRRLQAEIVSGVAGLPHA
ncbi:AfsR/SARP family transcriptional regulator [Allorhizocola rhizosphaerae]|uniref:AfsR/SARP family transcriptional regulator n=1 Tax=Allorhizocola rhizosphaerae TaxID=1872709 RepID=UPI000E3D3D49|nr:AfsR/SARP family transcriptional regulator [Allorhizocola rhizosphaerae]